MPSWIPGSTVRTIKGGGDRAEISTRLFQLVTGRKWKARPLAARAAAPMCPRSSTGTWTAISTSTT